MGSKNNPPEHDGHRPSGGGDQEDGAAGEANALAPLLTDAEFADLMTAEMAATRAGLDDMTRQRLWKKLEGKLAEVQKSAPALEQALASVQKAPGPRQTSAGAGVELAARAAAVAAAAAGSGGWRRRSLAVFMAAAAAVLLLSFGGALKRLVLTPEPFGEQLKGGATGTAVRLVPYLMETGGELMPLGGGRRVNVGETLVFKTVAASDSVVALILADDTPDQAGPTVRFIGSQTRAGTEQLLERDGRAYGYKVEGKSSAGGLRRFCAVAESDASHLSEVLSRLPQVFASLTVESCFDLPDPAQPPKAKSQ